MSAATTVPGITGAQAMSNVRLLAKAGWSLDEAARRARRLGTAGVPTANYARTPNQI
jgi:hypothetical protein